MATELAKAYVQIIPSAKGIKGSISNVLGGEAENAGKAAGTSIASKIKGVIAAAGIGAALAKTISSSLKEGADLQQSIGGVETLFKESAYKVIANAKNAYKTAVMSANEYMETVTSFSASLLQGLAGDTDKAAVVADMAMTDMSDNANKMGTSMESIQNAYQGFAKQNYTMLDNLKLGYGGTKTEMERLLKDAQKFSGVKYDISNLSDVYEAIHVIQEEMDITGTTAKEASKTFSGSFTSMKAALSNFLGNLSLGKDVGPSLKTLLKTTKTFLVDNFVPMVGNIVKSIGNLISTADWKGIATKAINKIIKVLETNIPVFLKKGKTLVNNIVNGITEKLPSIVKAGERLLSNITKGIINNLPKIAESAAKVVAKLASTILKNAPKILESGISLIGKLAAGLIKAIPDLVSKIPEIVRRIKKAFSDIDWGAVGKNILQGIARGITNAIGSIVDAAKDAAKKALDSAKKALGIKSPSRVFENEVGKMIDEGMAKGIKGNLGSVVDSMKALSRETVGMIDTDFSIPKSNVYSSNNAGDDVLYQIIELLNRYLPSINSRQMVLDTGVLVGELAPSLDKEMGKIKIKKGRGR